MAMFQRQADADRRDLILWYLVRTGGDTCTFMNLVGDEVATQTMYKSSDGRSYGCGATRSHPATTSRAKDADS